jgi:hypothetical protein
MCTCEKMVNIEKIEKYSNSYKKVTQWWEVCYDKAKTKTILVSIKFSIFPSNMR